MSHYKKLYCKIKNNPEHVSFNDMNKLLLAAGFKCRNRGSSHFIYSHPNLKDITDYVNIPFNRPHIKSRYIKKALDKIELVSPLFLE